jgi:hypothetical protein
MIPIVSVEVLTTFYPDTWLHFGGSRTIITVMCDVSAFFRNGARRFSLEDKTQWQFHFLAIAAARIRWHATSGDTFRALGFNFSFSLPVASETWQGYSLTCFSRCQNVSDPEGGDPQSGHPDGHDDRENRGLSVAGSPPLNLG